MKNLLDNSSAGQIDMWASWRSETGMTRDHKIVRFIGRHGIVAMAHVMEELGVGRTAAYRRVSACIEGGLVERLCVLRSEPNVLRATRAGLRYAGLGLPVAKASAGSIEHWLRCASMAQYLALEFGAEEIVSERELALAEKVEGHPIASARLGEGRMHRPDLVAFDEGRTVAIEVELTPKAPRRLEGLIRAWRRASWVAEVRYYCAPGQTRRAVERAVAKAYASERVRVMEAISR
jgi:hypothetical protein